ncbi:MAG: UDP-N-acetylmuramoyl-L-alanyl-D-glutamate--2,6-diaminopimelate ligase [Lautropia sp.]|nr:UDP-N-acetylmuramoyl-L-alanyl-D-glutamate--2,6-diaminopimelate ligase [Lautropia sp.]
MTWRDPGQEPAVIRPAQVPEWLRRHLPVSARLVADSRQVGDGDVFVALGGSTHDGARFVEQALAQGARAVLLATDPAAPPASASVTEASGAARAAGVPCAIVPGLKAHLGSVADEYLGHPSRALTLIAVTGTNGKTSVTHWIAEGVNQRLVAKSGEAGSLPRGRGVVIGTNGAGVPGQLQPVGLTTPDGLRLQQLLRDFADQAEPVAVVAMEASSIGLVQGRMDGTQLHAAVFTNLSRDHLDYHGSMQAYGEAKQLLFGWPGLQAAVINLDDPFADALLATVAARSAPLHVIGYLIDDAGALSAGVQARMACCDEVLCARRMEGTGWRLSLSSRPRAPAMAAPADGAAAVPQALRQERAGAAPGTATGGAPAAQGAVAPSAVDQQAILQLSVIGRFNLANTLAVAGAWRSLGWSLPEIAVQLQALRPVPGRMEMMRAPQADEAAQTMLPLVVVDYAHTPDALTHVLQALRQIAEARAGRLWCVFGAGGNRDRGKRPVMAAAVEALADQVVVTSDNPRHEDPQQILADVTAGLSRPAWLVEPDRAAAIAAAVAACAPADVVLVAGKGRERTQEIAGVFHPFSDPEVVEQALARRWSAGTPPAVEAADA